MIEIKRQENPVVANREEQLFAFDVPLELSADEVARLIDDVTPNGFYPWQVMLWPDAGVRVFYKRSKASNPGELASSRLKAAEIVRRAKDAEDAEADYALIEILATSPRVTVGVARIRLGRLGFRRRNDWVRDAIERAKAAKRHRA